MINFAFLSILCYNIMRRNFLKLPSNYYSEVGILRIINFLLKGVKNMPFKLIGKPILGEFGYCQVPSKMGPQHDYQISKITAQVPSNFELVMTSMTGAAEVQETNGEYFPKIREYNTDVRAIFNPYNIYGNCLMGKDDYRPGCDFIIWNSNNKIAAATFSREAPILAFESQNGKKALGVILRPSLMKYGEYLFSTMKNALGKEIMVTLITCNHYQYQEGSIPSVIEALASKYGMTCSIGANSETHPECYHRGESGNHVVIFW